MPAGTRTPLVGSFLRSPASASRGLRGGFLLAPRASGREAAIVEALLEVADGVAIELGADVFSLQYLPAAQAELAIATGLVARDELLFQESEVLTAVPEGGFDAWV